MDDLVNCPGLWAGLWTLESPPAWRAFMPFQSWTAPVSGPLLPLIGLRCESIHSVASVRPVVVTAAQRRSSCHRLKHNPLPPLLRRLLRRRAFYRSLIRTRTLRRRHKSRARSTHSLRLNPRPVRPQWVCPPCGHRDRLDDRELDSCRHGGRRPAIHVLLKRNTCSPTGQLRRLCIKASAMRETQAVCRPSSVAPPHTVRPLRTGNSPLGCVSGISLA